jgi:hypothetical protein
MFEPCLAYRGSGEKEKIPICADTRSHSCTVFNFYINSKEYEMKQSCTPAKIVYQWLKTDKTRAGPLQFQAMAIAHKDTLNTLLLLGAAHQQQQRQRQRQQPPHKHVLGRVPTQPPQ